MLVNFKTDRDLFKILDGGPWTYENCVLLMLQWESGMTGEDFCSNRIHIWVQLHHLPFELRNQISAKGLASIAGRVKDIGGMNLPYESNLGAEFPKFRIELASDEPIINGFFLERQTRKPTWIHFKYARLPAICFNCGRMNHDSRFCTFMKSKEKSSYGK